MIVLDSIRDTLRRARKEINPPVFRDQKLPKCSTFYLPFWILFIFSEKGTFLELADEFPYVHAEVCPGSNLERSFSNPLHLLKGNDPENTFASESHTEQIKIIFHRVK